MKTRRFSGKACFAVFSLHSPDFAPELLFVIWYFSLPHSQAAVQLYSAHQNNYKSYQPQ